MAKGYKNRGFDRNRKSEDRLSRVERRIDIESMSNTRAVSHHFFKSWFRDQIEFEWQLYIAGKKFPRKKYMTIRHAHNENANFEDKFYKKLDTDMSAKLSSWKMANKDYKAVYDRVFSVFRHAYLENSGENTGWDAAILEVKNLETMTDFKIRLSRRDFL